MQPAAIAVSYGLQGTGRFNQVFARNECVPMLEKISLCMSEPLSDDRSDTKAFTLIIAPVCGCTVATDVGEPIQMAATSHLSGIFCWWSRNDFSTGCRQEGPQKTVPIIPLAITCLPSTRVPPCYPFCCLESDVVAEDVKCFIYTERMHRSETNEDGESRRQLANPGSLG